MIPEEYTTNKLVNVVFYFVNMHFMDVNQILYKTICHSACLQAYFLSRIPQETGTQYKYLKEFK